MTPTFNIRDIPQEIAAAVDAAAARSESRSREAYLREYLKRAFGPEKSVNAGIASRAGEAIDQMETLGRAGALEPAPSIAVIARALGHPDTSALEGQLRGDVPFSFSDVDRLCGLFGLDRNWLESGSGPPRFSTRARHHDCEGLLHDFLQHGIPYQQLFFVLANAEDGDAAIIGHNPSDDPATGWRYDLLVDQIPIHDSVGGTGKAQRREFAELMVALYDDSVFDEMPELIGREVPGAHYMALLNGYVHPATATNTSGLGAASAVAHRSHWHEDFWNFGRLEAHTKSYAVGRAAFLNELRAGQITTTAAFKASVLKMIEDWNVQRVEE